MLITEGSRLLFCRKSLRFFIRGNRGHSENFDINLLSLAIYVLFNSSWHPMCYKFSQIDNWLVQLEGLQSLGVNKDNQGNTMKNLSKTILTVVAVGMLSGGLFCQQAQATPITGDITFGGVVTFDSTSLSLATQVSTWNLSIVTSDSGSFSSVPLGPGNVTMTAPWIFNPSTATIPLWSIGESFNFNLTSSTIVTQTNFFLNVTGVGTIGGAGFDTTPGTWSFTISNASGKTSGTFGFQSDTAAGRVPDGGATAGLLGFALAGVEMLRRNFKAA